MQNSPQNLSRELIDTRAEEYLAALLVRDRDAREAIADAIRLEMFATSFAHRVASAVYGLMAEQIEVDEASIVDRLTQDGDENPHQTLGLVKSLSTSPENAENYIQRVLEAFDSRELDDVLRRKLDELSARPPDYGRFRANLEDEILKDRVGRASKQVTVWDAVAAIECSSRGETRGFSWGMGVDLDELTGGITVGHFYAIGGLKKTGKTRFGLSVIADLTGNSDSEKRVPALIASLEMSALQIYQLLLARESNVESKKLLGRFLSSSNLHEIRGKHAEAIQQWPLYIVDSPGMSVEQIVGAMRRYSRKGVKVVMIDYIQRIDIPNQGDNRATAVQKAVNRLADAGRKYGMAVLAFSQIANRAEFSAEPTVGDFKESGGIAEACDCAMILHNLDRGANEKSNLFEVGVPVQRFGESGRKITLRHSLGVCRFFPVSSRQLAESSCERG